MNMLQIPHPLLTAKKGEAPSFEEQMLEETELLKFVNEFDLKDIPQTFRYSSA
jgi:hypothetical protein